MNILVEEIRDLDIGDFVSIWDQSINRYRQCRIISPDIQPIVKMQSEIQPINCDSVEKGKTLLLDMDSYELYWIDEVDSSNKTVIFNRDGTRHQSLETDALPHPSLNLPRYQ